MTNAKTILATLSFVVISLTTFSAQAKEEVNLGAEMTSMRLITENLYINSIDYSKKMTRKEKKNFSKNIDHLKDHVSSLKKASKDKSDTFKISYLTLNSHLDKVQSAIKHKEFSYARSLSRQIPTLCSSCHTQDQQQRGYDSTALNDRINTEFKRGEYHYMVRNYEKAKENYIRHLNEQKSVPYNFENKLALERIMNISIQFESDISGAIRLFEELNKSEDTNSGLKRIIGKWLEGMNYVKNELVPHKHKKSNNVAGILSYLKTYLLEYLDDPENVFLPEEKKPIALWLRGEIYEFMNMNPGDPDTPQMLYWLASIESALNENNFNQSHELYLKHCVISYPEHEYARKCFERYKNNIELQYTGSRGMRLPKYQLFEIKTLEEKLAK